MLLRLDALDGRQGPKTTWRPAPSRSTPLWLERQVAQLELDQAGRHTEGRPDGP